MNRAFFLGLLVCGCGPTEGRTANFSNGSNGGRYDLSLPAVEDMAMSLADLTQPKPDACAAVTAMATLTKKPVDIIVIVDNSASMSEEIAGIQSNINNNFAMIIGASGLDYRVIMLSRYNQSNYSGGYYRVCIKGPLGGNTNCDTEPKPINTSRFFQYNHIIDSWDTFKQILGTYNVRDPSCPAAPAACSAANGWSDWLRPDALKVFINFTDDMSDTTYSSFETSLFALTPAMFGDATNRNYVWYSVVGLKENSPATKAYAPADAIVTTYCSTAYDPGQDYQHLSQITGGLRFPVCQTASFDVVFQAVANGVVQGAKVACAFEVPDAPGGEKVDINTVEVKYTPSNGGPPKTFSKVDDLGHCTTSGNFYIAQDADLGTSQIVLCPDACTGVQGDDQAQIGVTFDCIVR
jgi:hypothetical protein